MSYEPTDEDLQQYTTTEPTSMTGAFLRSAGRTPFEVAQYFGYPEQYVPEIVKEKPGDVAYPLTELAGSFAVPGGALFKGLKLGKYGVQGYKALREMQRINELRKANELAQNQWQTAEEAGKGQPSPQTLEGKIQKAQEQAYQQQAKLADMQEPEPSALAKEAPKRMTGLLPGATGQDVIQAANEAAGQEIGAARAYLGHGEETPLDVQYQNQMRELIHNQARAIGRGYNQMQQRFSQQNVEIPRTGNVQQIQSELAQLAFSPNPNQGLMNQLLQSLERAQSSETVPADELLSQFRTLDKLAKNANSDRFARNPRLTEEQRIQYEDLANQYLQQADNLAGLLEEQVDPEFRTDLQGLNNQWRRRASLYTNPLGRAIEGQRGISGTDILGKLRGKETGQQYLTELTQSSLPALRAVIGHSFAENPMALTEATPYQQQFINQQPQVLGFQERLRQAAQQQELANRIGQAQQFEAERVQNAYNEDLAREQAKANARAQYEKEKLLFETKKAQEQAKLKHLEEEYKHYQKQKLETEHRLHDKKIRYQEKIRLESELKRIENNIARLKKIAINIGWTTLALGGAKEIAKLFHIFK